MFTLPDLPYSTNALEPHIDAQTMEIHHGKHHAAYVKNLSDALPDKTEAELEQILRTTKDPKVRNNGGGHYNHSLFWQMMTPSTSSGSATGKLLDGLNSKFGSLDGFKEKFAAAGMARFGSGWVWLTKDLEIVDTPNQDNPIMDGKPVILGLDVWEHAYYLKYQNRRASYIESWWNVVNWPFVSARYLEIISPGSRLQE